MQLSMVRKLVVSGSRASRNYLLQERIFCHTYRCNCNDTFVICVGWNFEIASADLVLPLGMSLGHAIEELMILE